MKKVKNILVSLALALALSLTAIAGLAASSVALAENGGKTAAARTSGEEVSYTIMNYYCYWLAEPFKLSPDTFESWIKLPRGSTGGTLFSNYASTGDARVTWAIDAFGRVKIAWDANLFVYTFDNDSVIDGDWHHIAVVRDDADRSFTLYVDGEFSDKVYSYQKSLPAGSNAFYVGTDYQKNGLKDPFQGYVSQVTVYNGAITQERVRQDMQTQYITDDYNGQMIGNWYLGEEWSERVVEDSAGSTNAAVLSTFNKYVGLDMDEFEYDYSIVEMPDIQCCVRYQYQKYINMMDWLAENADDLKVQWVSFLGDLSDSGPQEWIYRAASIGMSLLDGKVSYNFVPGNHDYDNNCKGPRKQVYYNTWFPYDKHKDMPGFGGVYEEGSMANSYYLYTAGGIDYLIINLEFVPRVSVLHWAGRLCEQYADRRVIVNTHSLITLSGDIFEGLDSGNSTFLADGGIAVSPHQIWENFGKLYPNIWMIFSGHRGADDPVMRTDYGVNGNTVYLWLLDTQVSTFMREGIGEDIMFVMKVNEKKRKIRCYYYSPYHNGVYGLQNQFEIDFPEGCTV